MISLLLAGFLLVQSPECKHFSAVMPEVRQVYKEPVGALIDAEARLALKLLLGVERPIEVLVALRDPSDSEVMIMGFDAKGCMDGWQGQLTVEKWQELLLRMKNDAS